MDAGLFQVTLELICTVRWPQQLTLTPGSAPPMRQLGSQESHRSGSTEHAAVNGVKRELPTSQSPSLGAVQANGDVTRSVEIRQSPSAALSVMPPPSGFPPRLASGSPRPQNLGLSAHASNNAASTAFDARLRQPGKGEKIDDFYNRNSSSCS